MRKLSENHKKNISKAMMGKKNSLGTHHTVSLEFREHRKKSWLGNQIWKGRHHTDEAKRKIGIASTKRQIGRKLTLEQRKKWSAVKKGNKHPNWKGGITPKNKRIHRSLEYRLWREAVFKRDNYTCIWCRARGVYLEPDHIKPFCDYPELRFAIDNGRTLCSKCHATTDTYKGKMNRRKSETPPDTSASGNRQS